MGSFISPVKSTRKRYLVVGVVDHGGLPLPLVVGVVDRRSFPGTAARRALADGVGDLWGLPFAVHVLIPDGQKDGHPSETMEVGGWGRRAHIASVTHQSSGLMASGSPMYSGSSSSQPSGFTASSSGI